MSDDPGLRLHRPDDILREAVIDAARDRLTLDPPPLDGARTPDELAAAAGTMITGSGLGGERALGLFTDVIAPACLSMDHPRYLAFVPNSASEAATAHSQDMARNGFQSHTGSDGSSPSDRLDRAGETTGAGLRLAIREYRPMQSTH